MFYIPLLMSVHWVCRLVASRDARLCSLTLLDLPQIAVSGRDSGMDGTAGAEPYNALHYSRM